MINDNRLEAIKASLEQHIQQLDLKGNPPELYDPITYLMSLGGKRIRPLLTLLAYGLYEEDYQKILTPATAIEVFHNFTLMLMISWIMLLYAEEKPPFMKSGTIIRRFCQAT